MLMFCECVHKIWLPSLLTLNTYPLISQYWEVIRIILETNNFIFWWENISKNLTNISIYTYNRFRYSEHANKILISVLYASSCRVITIVLTELQNNFTLNKSVSHLKYDVISRVISISVFLSLFYLTLQ